VLDAHLNTPLEYGKAKVDIAYEYTIENATARSAIEFIAMNPSAIKAEDGTETTIMHPIDKLEMQVLFPPGFRPNPEVRVDHLGATALPKGLKSNFDPVLGLFSLAVANPEIGSRIGIFWILE
jgi:hypothetical protein